MRHKLPLQVIAPVAVLGGFVLAASMAGAWYVDRLQSNRVKILLQDVASMHTAQDLEVELRQLRYHAMLYLLKPAPERLEKVQEDHGKVLESLRQAQDLADTQSEHAFLRSIESSYQRYYDD